MTLAAVPDPLAGDRAQRLADLLETTSPTGRARRAAAEILPVLAPLLPGGGLARGTIVETDEASLLLALAAGPIAGDPARWAAALNLPDLGLAAAAGFGLPLERLLVADQVDEHHFGEVVSVWARTPIADATDAYTGPRSTDRSAARAPSGGDRAGQRLLRGPTGGPDTADQSSVPSRAAG